MFRETLNSHNGYDIYCINNLSVGQKKAVIICHGFASSKTCSIALRLNNTLPPLGIGTFSFDFPEHGESRACAADFRISNCLDDLAQAEQHVRQQLPTAEIAYFGSSFGAYIILLYLATRPHSGKQAFLRSAAINIPSLFQHAPPEDQIKVFPDHEGYIIDLGFSRKIRINREFVDDLTNYDAFDLYQPHMAELQMIHGSADKIADSADVLRFAAAKQAAITILPGASHRLMDSGEEEQVLELAKSFFSPADSGI